MTINIRLALLDLAAAIGRDLRPHREHPISYSRALDVLESVEDKLCALAALLPGREPIGLSGGHNAYLPTRHPAYRIKQYTDGTAYRRWRYRRLAS